MAPTDNLEGRLLPASEKRVWPGGLKTFCFDWWCGLYNTEMWTTVYSLQHKAYHLKSLFADKKRDRT